MIEADIRSARARRRALKRLAKRLSGRFERVPGAGIAGDRVRFERHGATYLVYFEVVMAADDPSSYTRVQLLKPDSHQSFPSVAIVPEDFLERADNLLFGREDRNLDSPALDERVLVRAEPGANLEAIRAEPVLKALEAFLDAGAWHHDFILESVPDQLRISLNYHIEDGERLEAFAVAAADLLAAFPTVPIREAQADG